QQGMADMGKIYPDLMGAPSLELTGQQRRDRFAVAPLEAFLDLPMGHGLTAALAHRHFLAGMRMAVDRLVHRAALPAWHPPDKRHIAAPHRPGTSMIGELRGQRLVSTVVLGDHHQSGGVLVEPMHDTRTPDPADP